jgi:putative tryptophan/tyrosine transport system substrate-binding protein
LVAFPCCNVGKAGGSAGKTMKRREFISLFGGVAAWPLAAQAQQPDRVQYKVAWIATTSPLSELVGPNPSHPLANAFLRGLHELGYNEGKNLQIEWRSAEGKFDNLPAIIQQLIIDKVDIIVAPANEVIQAAKSVTQTVPIVMVGTGFPEEQQYVQSLARPGGNITGLTGEISLEMTGKRLQIIKELLPNVTRLAWLGASEGFTSRTLVETASRDLGLELVVPEYATNDFTSAFAIIMRSHVEAVFVGQSPLNFANRHLIVEFAARNRLPALYVSREYVDAGGLISYGVSLSELNRRAASYVDRILKGAKPSDLPVEQPTKFDLIVNRKTARALDLIIPDKLLLLADEVIE